MLSGFGWSVLALLAGYLLLFFWGSAMAAQTTRTSIWLFGQARGRDRRAAFGFRAAFVLGFFGPLLWLAWRAVSVTRWPEDDVVRTFSHDTGLDDDDPAAGDLEDAPDALVVTFAGNG